MKNKLKIIGLLLIVFFSFEQAVSAQKMAVITKSKGNVFIKKTSSKKFDEKGKMGIVLEAGDAIKTGADGFIVMVFLDDKSQIKLYENCTLELDGVRQNNGLSKNINMGFGKLKAEVSRQLGGAEFKIATPTSVASVKGTEFWVISDESTGDQVIGLSGLVELLNSVSGQSVMVGSNQTGTSLPEGGVVIAQTQPESIPEETEEEGGDSGLNQLKFEYQNAEGNIREVIIDYR
ncbi:MAG: FecR domain-containing protein [Candidatus Marinimicrobia bacterium]|nr:FecR domain-containing protein [Candidatus Neomarinimicrobiota bacterium]